MRRLLRWLTSLFALAAGMIFLDFAARRLFMLPAKRSLMIDLIELGIVVFCVALFNEFRSRRAVPGGGQGVTRHELDRK